MAECLEPDFVVQKAHFALSADTQSHLPELLKKAGIKSSHLEEGQWNKQVNLVLTDVEALERFSYSLVPLLRDALARPDVCVVLYEGTASEYFGFESALIPGADGMVRLNPATVASLRADTRARLRKFCSPKSRCKKRTAA